VRAQTCFANEIAQGLRPTQPTRSMDQLSHGIEATRCAKASQARRKTSRSDWRT
jgi:hypothetical protein